MSAFVALPILGIGKSAFQATVKGREETWREDSEEPSKSSWGEAEWSNGEMSLHPENGGPENFQFLIE